MRPRWLTRRLDALPIRWRLAVTSAGLTFVILLAFAVVIGMFTANRLRSDFDNDLRATAAELDQRLQDEITIDPFSGETQISGEDVVAATVGGGATGDAAVRILYPNGDVLFPEEEGPSTSALPASRRPRGGRLPRRLRGDHLARRRPPRPPTCSTAARRAASTARSRA